MASARRPTVLVGGAQPVLPTDEDLRERLGREVEVDDVDVLGWERGEGQRGRHTKVAATAAPQCPEQVGIAGGGRGHRLTAGKDHRRRGQLVTEQAGMPRLGTHAAAERVSRGTDRGTGTGRDPAPGRGQRPVHRVQARGRRNRHLSRSGVVVGVCRQLAQVEHHGSVCGRRADVGVSAAARSDLEVMGGRESHRLLDVGSRCRGDNGRRCQPVVIGIENLLSSGELRAVRKQNLAAESGGQAFPTGRFWIGSDPGRPENRAGGQRSDSASQKRLPRDFTRHRRTPAIASCPELSTTRTVVPHDVSRGNRNVPEPLRHPMRALGAQQSPTSLALARIPRRGTVAP